MAHRLDEILVHPYVIENKRPSAAKQGFFRASREHSHLLLSGSKRLKELVPTTRGRSKLFRTPKEDVFASSCLHHSVLSSMVPSDDSCAFTGPFRSNATALQLRNARDNVDDHARSQAPSSSSRPRAALSPLADRIVSISAPVFQLPEIDYRIRMQVG